MIVRASSRLLAVLGDPVGHSLSPAMQNAAIAALGLDAVYVALRVPASEIRSVLAALRTVGAAGNVTVPLKISAHAAMDRLTDVAVKTGAVNTFTVEAGELVGDNTDVAGVRAALAALDASPPWLLVGTGGAAHAVAVAAAEEGVPLLIRSRARERAEAFCRWARDVGVAARSDDGRPIGSVINATPLGLHPSDPLPISLDRLAGAVAALDLVYTAGETPWVRACRDAGLAAADGRTMLVEQGIAAFGRFFPGVKPPREIMAAAVHRALAT